MKSEYGMWRDELNRGPRRRVITRWDVAVAVAGVLALVAAYLIRR